MKYEHCQRCGSDRILSLSAKCRDLCSSQYKDREHDGYVPDIDCLGSGGSYLDIDVCLECGQLQGLFPVPETSIDAALPKAKVDPDEIEIDESETTVNPGPTVGWEPKIRVAPRMTTRVVEGVFGPDESSVPSHATTRRKNDRLIHKGR